MRAGTLRHRVTIQQRSGGVDALDQPLPDSWVDVATVWADVNPLSGRELLLAQAARTQLSGTVTIRFQHQFSDPVAMAARRIAYNGRYLNITASRDVDEMHQLIELSYSEGTNNG
jgi:SPP1 family predicted phage head-tail adaptor